MFEFFSAVGARFDSWVNLITGVGTNHRKTAFEYEPDGRLTDRMLTDLVRGDAFARRIVFALPQEALRQGITVKCGDAPVQSRIAERMKGLAVRGKLLRAWGWARQYGGAVIFVGADDGQKPDQPLAWDRIKSIRFLTVVDRRYVLPHTWVRDGLSPRFGQPELYRFSRTSAGGGTDTSVVHHSRLIRFDGALVDDETRNANQGWGDSELQHVMDKLRQFNAAYGAAGTLLQDSSQGVLKMQKLFALLAADKQGILKKRLELMELARSVGRSILVDADSESYERVEAGVLGGVPPVLESFALLLAGAVPMPVSVLMGRAPAGLNATGEMDMRSWYDSVQSERTNTLKPRAELLMRMILRAEDGPTAGTEPEQWSLEFPSLWQLSPAEEQDIRSKQAQTDVAYVGAGVLTAEEVATNRFRPEGYSTETSIDLEMRDAAMKADRAGEGGTAAPGGEAAEGIMDVVERVGTRAIDRAAGIGLLTTQFKLSPEQAEAVMGETGRTHFTTPEPGHAAEMEALKAQHASAQASARSAKQMLAGVLERNRKGELVVGRVIAAKPSDTEVGDVLEEGDTIAVPTDAPTADQPPTE